MRPPRELIGASGRVFTLVRDADAIELPEPPPMSAGDFEWAFSDDDPDHGTAAGVPNARAPNGHADAGTPISATPYRWVDPVLITPRQWLYGRHYIRKFLSVTISAGAVGKSSLALVEALSMAIGRDLLTGNDIPQRAVWFWNGEDPREEIERRIQAVALHYRLKEADWAGRLFIDSGREKKVIIATDERRNGVAVNRPLVDGLVAELSARAVDVLILDPFVKTHSVVENDNGAIDAVATALAGIAEAADCAIEVIHHVRKTNATELTVDDARGAVALIQASRSARVINSMTREEAIKAAINPVHKGLYFRVDTGKANLAPPADKTTWRRLVGVGLGNARGDYPEDAVGVVVAWKWPDAFAGLTADHLRQVQNKVAAGKWRASVQSDGWVGNAVAEVLDLDLAEPANKERVKALLKGWIKTEALKEVELEDGRLRKKKKFVEVEKWVEG
jgi:hypothetical protein